MALLASCVAPTPPPVPVAEPVAPPSPPPAPPPPVAWEDAPLTPGTWVYRDGVARFGVAGAASVTLACDAAGRALTLSVGGPVPADAIDVTTSYGKRRLPAAPANGAVAARLAANDGVLDWMAFSRGRFRLDIAGLAPFTLPAWPEISRVIEDCRK